MDEEDINNTDNYHDGIKELRERLYKQFEESTKSEREIYEDAIRKLDIKYNEKYHQFCKIRDENVAEALISERKTIEHAEELCNSKITPEIKELYDKEMKLFDNIKEDVWSTIEDVMYPNIVKIRNDLRDYTHIQVLKHDMDDIHITSILEKMYPYYKNARIIFEKEIDNLRLKGENENIIYDAETEYNNTIKQSKIDFQNAIDTAKNVFRMIMNPIQLDYDLAKNLANDQYNKSIADKRKIYENALIKAQEEYELSRQPKVEVNEFGMV